MCKENAMNKQEMIELQGALATIPTVGEHTLTMANCLRFLEQKITEAAIQEHEEKEDTATE